MFTELPFVFIFPYAIFFTIFGLSIVVSMAGSYFAMVQFRDYSIASIVKGLF